MSINKTKIPHQRNGQDVIGFGAYRLLESFNAAAGEEIRDDVRKRFKVALQDFPELAHETVTIGQMERHMERDNVAACAGMRNRIVYLPTDRRTSFMTVYHELAHLAVHILDERGEDVPITSEEYCSIFAVSRMSEELIDRDTISYLGEPDAPREDWPGICQRALEYREDHRNYIQKCKEWLEIE